jgi:hypothetical protein
MVIKNSLATFLTAWLTACARPVSPPTDAGSAHFTEVFPASSYDGNAAKVAAPPSSAPKLYYPGGGLPPPPLGIPTIGSVPVYNDAGMQWLNSSTAGQALTASGLGGNLGFSTTSGLGPPGTTTVPPSVSLNDAGGWLWVNQQGSSFTNTSAGLVLTTTYNGTATPFGALVEPLAGSATASVAASWVWTSTGTGATSSSYVGFGVAMFCSASNKWGAFTIVDQWDQNSSIYIPYLQVNYFNGTSLTSNTNIETALAPRGYVILRMRMTGTSNGSPVDFELSEDGVTYSLALQVTNTNLFGSGNLATDVGFAFLLPNNTGMTGSTNATFYNYVTTN